MGAVEAAARRLIGVDSNYDFRSRDVNVGGGGYSLFAIGYSLNEGA